MLGSVKTGNRSLPPITDRNFLFHPLGSLPAEGPGSCELFRMVAREVAQFTPETDHLSSGNGSGA
jgi:hypothetical protein